MARGMNTAYASTKAEAIVNLETRNLDRARGNIPNVDDMLPGMPDGLNPMDKPDACCSCTIHFDTFRTIDNFLSTDRKAQCHDQYDSANESA